MSSIYYNYDIAIPSIKNFSTLEFKTSNSITQTSGFSFHVVLNISHNVLKESIAELQHLNPFFWPNGKYTW